MIAVPLGELISPSPVRRAGVGNYPVLSMTMRDGLVDQSRKFKKRVASEDVSAYKVISRGQLVVGFPIDEGVLDFQDLYDAAIVSPAYGVWDVDERAVHRPYLSRFLRSPKALGYYKAKLRGSTARRRSLPTPVFLALPIPLPPLEKQKSIATALANVDRLRANRLAVGRALSALVHSLFTDEFDAEIHANRSRLSSLVDEFKYGTSEKSTPSGVPVLRIPNVLNGAVNLADLKFARVEDREFDRLRLKDGDLLFVRTNGNPENVGRCAVFSSQPFQEAGLMGNDVIYASYLIRARLSDGLNPQFAATYLNGIGRPQLTAQCKTSAGQYNINIEGIGAVQVPIPSLDRQLAFVQRANRILHKQEQCILQLTQIDALLASLQSRAFSGRL